MKRPRSPDAAAVQPSPPLQEVAPQPPVSPSPSSHDLSPSELWKSADIQSWTPYLPPHGRQFQRALQLFRNGMKRPSPDVLFESDAGRPLPYFSNTSYTASPSLQGVDGAPISSSSSQSPNTEPFVSHATLVMLMNRKMSRGAFRPGLLQQVQSNPPSAVFDSICAAFGAAAAGELHRKRMLPKEAAAAVMQLVKPLTALRGVGPATASLAVSRFVWNIEAPGGSSGTPAEAWLLPTGVCPFMSDEAASIVLATPAAKLKYTLGELAAFVESIYGKYDALADSAKDAARSLTPDAIGHALWAATVISRTR